MSNFPDRTSYPLGLRNIGNTCFLNSIIQFLYGAQDLRNQLIEKYEKQQNMRNAKFSKLIGKLFSYMKQKSQESHQIEQILNLMANRLQQMNTQYQRHSQEDALQTLLNIILEIEQKHPDISTTLDIEYKANCFCTEFVTKERVLSYSSNICSACNQILRRTLLHKPKYIMYSNPANEEVLNQKIEQLAVYNPSTIQQKSKLFYRLKAQVIYMGNGRSGHYVAHRVDENQQFIFNDSSVYLRRDKNYNGLILLYEKEYLQQIIMKSIVNIQNEKYLSSNNYSIYQELNITNDSQKIIENLIKQSKISNQPKQVLPSKVQLNIIYKFQNIFVNKKPNSLYFAIKRGRYGFYLDIINKQAYPFQCRFDTNFHNFYNSCIVKSPTTNKLQRLGLYIQEYLNSCLVKPKEKRKMGKKIISDLVYDLQKNIVEKSRLRNEQ